MPAVAATHMDGCGLYNMHPRAPLSSGDGGTQGGIATSGNQDISFGIQRTSPPGLPLYSINFPEG